MVDTVDGVLDKVTDDFSSDSVGVRSDTVLGSEGVLTGVGEGVLGGKEGDGGREPEAETESEGVGGATTGWARETTELDADDDVILGDLVEMLSGMVLRRSGSE